MCLCNSYLQMVTAAVDVNHPEQFMEVLNKELFLLTAVQKKKKKTREFPEALGSVLVQGALRGYVGFSPLLPRLQL